MLQILQQIPGREIAAQMLSILQQNSLSVGVITARAKQHLALVAEITLPMLIRRSSLQNLAPLLPPTASENCIPKK